MRARSIPVVPFVVDSMNIERNRAFQIISFGLYDVRECTDCENVSSFPDSRTRNSASFAASVSGVQWNNGLDSSIGCTTVQLRAKNVTLSNSSGSDVNSRTRSPFGRTTILLYMICTETSIN